MLKEGEIFAEGKPVEVITAENVREVFGADTTIYPHPENNLPMVLPNGNHRQQKILN
jgi:iron complex transport system ATP-binding protein